MTAPTMPLGRDGLMQASTASAGSLPSMFAADLEGPAEPEIQKWEWTYENMLHRGSRRAASPFEDGRHRHALTDDGAYTVAFYEHKGRNCPKKNADKLTPQAVREAFEGGLDDGGVQ